MARVKDGMKKLREERDRLLAQIDALRNQVAGLERAMSLLGSDDAPARVTAGKRGGVTSQLIELLQAVGTSGLNADSAVEMAKNRGVQLEKTSVSSLLSRLKREGLVVFDGKKYRLKEYVADDDKVRKFPGIGGS